MLMTIGGVTVAAVLLTIAIYTGKVWLRNFVFGGGAVWFVFYFAMLLGFSLTSQERELVLDEPKEFCGFYFDCHMHTAVTGVRTTKKIGNKTAKGEFYIVAVKVSSDAKRATLGFGGLELFVVDDARNVYHPSTDVENPEPPFTRPVGAGESFETEIVFDLPADVQDPRLDIHDDHGWIETLLVDDEDSLLHKRAYFKLDGHEQTATLK